MLTNHPVLDMDPIITQGFGPANWDAVYTDHTGVDFGGEFTVGAARAGKVIFAGMDTNSDPKWKGGYGLHVIIDHGLVAGKQVVTLYAHLKAVEVKVGDAVIGGQVLGPSDSTGYSTGSHLHFGLKIGGEWVDPLPYLNLLQPGNTPQGDGTALIVGYDVNMRVAPGLTQAILGTLAHNTIATVLDGFILEADGIKWVRVQPPAVYIALSTKTGTPLAQVKL